MERFEIVIDRNCAATHCRDCVWSTLIAGTTPSDFDERCAIVVSSQ